MSELDDLKRDAERAIELGDKDLALRLYRKIDQSSGSTDKLSSSDLDKTTEWSSVPSEAVRNIVPSGINVAKETLESIIHPIDTAQSVLDLGNAALQKILPDSVREIMYKINPDTAKNPDKLLAAASYFKNRYGTEEGWKDAISKDPSGVVADMFSVLQPARALAKGRVPIGVEKALEVAGNLDPTVLTTKALEKVPVITGKSASTVLGKTTGAGSIPVEEAFKAGQEGGDKLAVLTEQMRGKGDISEPIDVLKSSLKNMRNANTADYTREMDILRQDKTPLNLAPIEDSIKNALSIKKYEGFDKDPALQSTRNDILNAIKEFKEAQRPNALQRMQGNVRPNDLNTVAGFDALKQRISSIADWNEPRSPATIMASNVTNAIKDEIAKQSDDYARIMADYAKRETEAKDIEKTFSLSKKAREETQANKAQGLTRDNVNTSYGLRLQKAKALEPYGAENLLPMLSGQSLSSWSPRGLAGGVMAATAGAGLSTLNPWIVPALAIESPRLIGETAVKAGQASRLGKAGLGALKKALEAGDIDKRMLTNLMYQTQNLQNEE